jgi:Ala-tRNA(Pro) deacylase
MRAAMARDPMLRAKNVDRRQHRSFTRCPKCSDGGSRSGTAASVDIWLNEGRRTIGRTIEPLKVIGQDAEQRLDRPFTGVFVGSGLDVSDISLGGERMAIAKQLEWYLEASGFDYEILPHPHSAYSAQTARRSRIPLHCLAKPVLFEDEYGYLMAIVPAARRVDINRLGAQLNRDLALATEAEVDDLFHDCENGAMPAIGSPYQIPTVYDDSLEGLSDIYFEAGDHDDVVHMAGEDFLELLSGSLHGRFSLALSAAAID